MINNKGISARFFIKTSICLMILAISILPLVCFSWSSKQEVLAQGVSKSLIIDQLERFVILNGYRFRIKDKKNGRFQIFVKKTEGFGKAFNLEKTIFYKSGNKVSWTFSVEISQLQNDTKILGYSQGGLAPGKYFNKFINELKQAGLNIIDSTKILNQPPSNEIKQNNIPSIDELELQTFNKTNQSLILEERLSLLELHYFHKQLGNLSTDARLMAIQNEMQSPKR